MAPVVKTGPWLVLQIIKRRAALPNPIVAPLPGTASVDLPSASAFGFAGRTACGALAPVAVAVAVAVAEDLFVSAFIGAPGELCLPSAAFAFGGLCGLTASAATSKKTLAAIALSTGVRMRSMLLRSSKSVGLMGSPLHSCAAIASRR